MSRKRRLRRAKPDPQARPAVANEHQDAIANRDAIARLYGHRPLTPALVITAGTIEPIDQREKGLALDPQKVVDFLVTASDPPAPVVPSQPGVFRMATVTLNYKGLAAKNKIALYTGTRTVQRIPITNFPDPKNPPATLELSGELAGPREMKPKRVKLTPEEVQARREARKTAPKPTLAEQIAKREEKLAREQKRIAELKAKASQPELQPA